MFLSSVVDTTLPSLSVTTILRSVFMVAVFSIVGVYVTSNSITDYVTDHSLYVLHRKVRFQA